MLIKIFPPFLNSSVKDFVMRVLASEGFTYDLEKDLDLDGISANYLEEGSIFYVAFIKGRIVGTCAVKKRSFNKCEIKRLYVHKDFQRMGIGSKLLEKALGFACQRYGTATLKTDLSLAPAIALYFKTGFSVEKEEKGIVYLKKELS